MFTPWGYEVDVDSDGIPPLVDVDDFNEMTNGKYAGELLVATALQAASNAVRNACGWHVSPSLDCTATVTPTGKLAKLPANHVSSYESVKEMDERTGAWVELSVPGEASVDRDGIIRRHGFKPFPNGRFNVRCEYTAGYEPEAIGDVAFAVMGITEGVLSLPKGVASESADGVSISYSVQAQSVANAMTEQFRMQLAPYRLVSSHAA